MKILYIDESGGFEAPSSSPGATPLMVIAGLAVDASKLSGLTTDFLRLKARFYPGKARGPGRLLDYVLAEVKGADVRSAVRSSSRDRRRHAIGFLDALTALLVGTDSKLLARVWIKATGHALDPRASYTFAIQDLARHFNHFLEAVDDIGLMLCDGRLHYQDAQVSHSVFTQKHKAAGDSYPRIIEATVFGRSENHVGLQLADLVASALLFPIAARTYCAGHARGPHVSTRFDPLKRRFGPQLRPLQYRYQDVSGRWRGGVVVSDKMGSRPSSAMFI